MPKGLAASAELMSADRNGSGYPTLAVELTSITLEGQRLTIRTSPAYEAGGERTDNDSEWISRAGGRLGRVFGVGGAIGQTAEQAGTDVEGIMSNPPDIKAEPGERLECTLLGTLHMRATIH